MRVTYFWSFFGHFRHKASHREGCLSLLPGVFELEMGLEPTTYGLQDRCATDCATPAHWALTRAKHEYPARFR